MISGDLDMPANVFYNSFMVRWQSDYALDCKPGLGRFNSYPDLQVSKLDVLLESQVANASKLALVCREVWFV